MKKLYITVGFIIGMLLSGTIVYATNYLAKDITYRNTTVENALNDLYKNESLEGTEIYKNSAYSDERKLSNAVTLELNKGKYICNATYSAGSSTDQVSNYNDQVTNIIPKVTGCNNPINTYVKAQYAKTATNVNYMFVGFVTSGVNFICDVDSTKTINVDFTATTENSHISTGREIICNKIK